jgi:nickel/cobalt exporter
MYSIIAGSVLLSLLHALIPSHWLPILAIGKKEKWSLNEVLKVTLFSGLAHVLSTILIGGLLGFLGLTLAAL